jgi:DNA-binding MarR family transcriptional regulator/GNAT superfamily N-acetyltransferase
MLAFGKYLNQDRDRSMAATAPTALVRAFGREFAVAGGLLAADYLESGLSLGEGRSLYELGLTPGLSPSALAKRLNLDLGYVSRVITRLVGAGLAQKRRADDRRMRHIELTHRGKTRLAALASRTDARLSAWLSSKPPATLAELERGLGAFLKSPPEAPPNARIRAARPGDVGRIITRHGEIYVGEFGYPPSVESYIVDAFAKFLRGRSPRDRIFVAEADGRFAGAVAAKALASATVQLRFLIVEPFARGTGLGRRLLQAVVDHARVLRSRRVVLETASDLSAARRLYSSAGFRRTRTIAGAPWLRRGVLSERWELDARRNVPRQTAARQDPLDR